MKERLYEFREKKQVMSSWASEVASRCVFCNKNLESSSHLFIHCHFAWHLWMKFLHGGVLSMFSQNLLMICTPNGFLRRKTNNRISHDSFSSPALCEIFGFIGMISSLIGLLQTFKAVFPWSSAVSHYGWDLIPILQTLLARMFITAMMPLVLKKGGAEINCIFSFATLFFFPRFETFKACFFFPFLFG